MGSRTTGAILLGLPCYYLTCCVVAVVGGLLSGAMNPGGIVPGFIAMVMFGWMFMLAAVSGSSGLGDVREMQLVMLASLAITPLVLWLWVRWGRE